nr:immunoglobulin heavy chain junction region [Macaca mulatta]MOV44856.1 immunoglobulin heavy chain junction region [Macaca mulatta]
CARDLDTLIFADW